MGDAYAMVKKLEDEIKAREANASALNQSILDAQSKLEAARELASELAAIDQEINQSHSHYSKIQEEVTGLEDAIRRRKQEEEDILNELKRAEMEEQLEAIALERMKLRDLEEKQQRLDMNAEITMAELSALQELMQDRNTRITTALYQHLQNTSIDAHIRETTGDVPMYVAMTVEEDHRTEELNSSKLLGNILDQRKKERVERAQAREGELQRLDHLRQGLLERRDKLLEHKRVMMRAFQGGKLTQGQEHIVDSLDRIIAEIDSSFVQEPVKRTPVEPVVTYRGELGISSYEEWQLPHYHMVRGLVNDIIDSAFQTIVIKNISTSMQERYMHIERDTLQEQLAAAQLDARAWNTLTDMQNEVIEETIHSIWKEIEATQLAAGKMMHKIVQDAAKSIKKLSYNQVHLLERAYAAMRAQRRAGGRVVCHTQRLLVVGQPGDDPADDDYVYTDVNMSVVEAAAAVPVFTGHHWCAARDSGEDAFWGRQHLSHAAFTPPFKMGGVSVCVPSPQPGCLAVGGAQGEVLVLRREGHAWVLVRAVGPRRGTKDLAELDYARVRALAWSRDGQRIAALDTAGTLRIWSLHRSGPVSEAGDSLALALEVTRSQFMFHGGPFAEGGDVTFSATTATFAPSFTLTGLQPDVVVGFSNGDIIKCDAMARVSRTSLLPPPVEAPANMRSVIGKDIPAELFRGHKSPILYVGWVGNTWPMVSVDTDGHLFLWDYKPEYHTGFGWFIPMKKYRLNLSERQYQPASKEGGKIHFSAAKDKKEGKHGRTKNEIRRQREDAERKIEELRLPQPPWHEEVAKDGTVTSIFAPSKSIKVYGDVFYVLKKTAAGVLVELSSRLYQPIANPCVRVLALQQTPGGGSLVLMVLYPEVSSKPAHITILLLALATMAFSDVRIDIPLSEQEFQRCLATPGVCDISTTPLLPQIARDAVFVTVFGRLRVFSLSTGQEIVLGGGWQSLLQHVPSAVACGGDALVTFSGKTSRLAFVHMRDPTGPLVSLQGAAAAGNTRMAIEDPSGAYTRSLDGWKANVSSEALAVVSSLVEALLDAAWERAEGRGPSERESQRLAETLSLLTLANAGGVGEGQGVAAAASVRHSPTPPTQQRVARGAPSVRMRSMRGQQVAARDADV